MKNPLCVLTLVLLIASASAAASREPTTLKLADVMEDTALELKFENGMKVTVTTKGTRIPPGTYWVKSLRLFKKDEKGRVWEMRCTGDFGSLKNITVAAEQEKVLLLGPTIALRLGARRGEGTEASIVRVRLSAAGVASESYFPGAHLNGRRAPAPTFRITDEDGKALAAGRFEVSGNTCTYDWYIPRGYKGRYNIEIEPTLGPFKWGVQRASTFEIE